MAGGRVVGSSRSDRAVRLLARGLHPNQCAVLDSRWHSQMDTCWSRGRQLRILSVSDLGESRADEMTELYSVRNIYPILASVSRPSKFDFPSSHPSSPGRQQTATLSRHRGRSPSRCHGTQSQSALLLVSFNIMRNLLISGMLSAE